jgi:hypothetical protein
MMKEMIMTQDEVTARQAWRENVKLLYPEIIRDPVARALRYIAERVFLEQDAQIARLRAELDTCQGRKVVHCMGEDAYQVMLDNGQEHPGTILRATDTGAEWEMAGDGWHLRPGAL